MGQRTCTGCKIELKNRHNIRFCSNRCQKEHDFAVFISAWRSGLVNGTTGVRTKTLSAHIRRYLREKHDNKCSMCGWDKQHPLTNTVPLEIDHIDGNSENNMENNLQLLCPNCHSLTSTYKNLNKGKGRKWRMEKYIKNQLI